MDWAKLLGTPGLIGAFIAILVLLFMAIKNHRELRRLESYKVELAFAKEKLDIKYGGLGQVQPLLKSE
jgi:hypothetical protein